MTPLVLFVVYTSGCVSNAEIRSSRQLTARAQELLARGDSEGAKEKCREALKSYSHNLAANHLMGRLHIEAGRPDKARKYLSRATKLPGDVCRLNAPDLQAAAESFLILGKAYRARRLLEETAGVHPECARLMLLRAIAHFKAKEFTAAVESVEEYVECKNGAETSLDILWEIYARYLTALVRGGNAGKGLDRALKAVELFPDSALMKALLGRCLADAGKVDKAGRVIEAALALDPYHGEVVRQARYYYVMQGQSEKALNAWRRAVPLGFVDSPDNKLSEMLRSLGFLSNAAENLTGDYTTQFDLARCYKSMGWLDEAIMQCRNAIRIKPDGYEAVREMARLLNHRDFVRAARVFIYDIYRLRLRGQKSPDISAVTAALCRIARSCEITLPIDADSVYKKICFGREVHTINHRHSALVRYFLEFGQYLLIAQIHEPVTCKIANIAAWFEMNPGDTIPCFANDSSGRRCGATTAHSWVLCDEDSVYTFAGYVADYPRVTGHASLSRKGYFVDMQPLRPSMNRLRSIVGTLRGDSSENGWTRDMNALTGSVMSGLRLPEDDDGAACDAVFQRLMAADVNAVATHEEGHVVDMKMHLPIFMHIPSFIVEGVRARLSPTRIHNRIEFYAEAFAAANACYPHIVLLNNLRRLAYPISREYNAYLLYYLSLERKQLSPYTNVAQKLYDFLTKRLETAPPGSGEIGPALAELTPQEAAELNAEFCRRDHMKWPEVSKLDRQIDDER